MVSERLIYLANKFLSDEKIRSVKDKTGRGVVDPLYSAAGCNMIGETVSMSVLINGLATTWPQATTLKHK